MQAWQITEPCPACDVPHTTYWVRPDGDGAPLLEWESYNPIIRVSEHDRPPAEAAPGEVAPGDEPEFSPP